MTTFLKSPVAVSPLYLNGNLMERIKRQLKEEVEGTITPKEGRIESIVTIKEILNKGIVRPLDNYIVFEVIYEAKTFAPKVGDVYEAKIKLVNEAGIMCTKNDMDIFVQAFKLEKDLDEYKVGDMLKIKLLGIKMDDNIIAFGDEIEE